MFFFSSRRRHTRSLCDWSSDVCSSDLAHLRQLFRIRKAATYALDNTSVAADVIRRAHMAQRIGFHDPHRVARPETEIGRASLGKGGERGGRRKRKKKTEKKRTEKKITQ